MNRASPAKRQEQAKLAYDVESYLANGGQITELPGFGMAPRITQINASKFELGVGNDNSLNRELDEAIKRDLLAGMGTTQTARKHNVGTTTVTKRKDSLMSKGLL